MARWSRADQLILAETTETLKEVVQEMGTDKTFNNVLEERPDLASRLEVLREFCEKLPHIKLPEPYDNFL